MFTPNELLNSVNSFIDNLAYDRKPETIYAPIKYVLSIGGKRIRPVLMLLAYNLYKDDPEGILKQACALETYHNYTLLHDDLMDNAELRRGKPTVHKKWDANTAILSGDSMLVLAYQRMADCPAAKLKPVLDLFTETALEIGEGQQYDMDFEVRNDVTEEEYIEMIRLKTAVLLGGALKIGALIAGATDNDAKAIYDFGVNLGLAFQLRDDYLDVYGDARVFGKNIGGDILNNKKTYMLINAQRLAQGADREELDRWLSATDYDPAEKIAAVTALYNRLGVDRLCLEKIEQYDTLSLQQLDSLSVPADRTAPLRELAARLMQRNF